jgi:ATP-binding cassette subfamily B protein
MTAIFKVRKTPATEGNAGRIDWRSRVAALRNVPPLMAMVWNCAPGFVAYSGALRLLSAGTPVAQLWITKLIIDRVVHAISTHQTHNVTQIWLLVALDLLLAMVQDIIARSTDFIDSLLGERFNNHVTLKIMEHASQLDLATLEEPVFNDRLERARAQSDSRLALLAAVGRVSQSVVMLIAFAAAVLSFSPALFLLLTACVLPVFFNEAHFATLSFLLTKTQTPLRREMEYMRVLGASYFSAKEVKLFGLDRFLMDRYRRIANRCYVETRGLTARRAVTSSSFAFVGIAGYSAALCLIIYRTLSGQITLGDLTFLAGAFYRASGGMYAVFSGLSVIADQALFLTDLFEFLRSKPAIPPSAGLIAPRPIRYGFEFQNVSFRYAGADRPVLRNVSFRIEPEQRIALVGANGAGKTTLVKLLTRLYEPTAGRILLDSVDIRDYILDDLRREIGVIFQDFVRYDMIVSENIGMGRVHQIDDLVQVQIAAERSRASRLIERIPKGYAQMLGRRFDGGVELSGGEWQKIALARAYMRQAQVLVLDEPTAALDARAEYEVFSCFADITKGRMSLLISHRFSTVRMADRILVLEGGEIKEQGTHHQLLGLQGRYAELFTLQASGYR